MKRKTLSEQLGKQMRELEYAAEAELSDNLDDNEAELKKIFANCADLVVRRLRLFDSVPCMVAYLAGLVDDKMLEDGLLKPLLKLEPTDFDNDLSRIWERLKSGLPSVAEPSTVANRKEIVHCIVKGEVVLFVESSKQATSFKLNNPLHRQLEEPNTEAVIRGPRIGFIEKLDINMVLIRQRIRSPRLKMEKFVVGELSHTDVTIAYIENIAPQSVIEEVRRRISSIEMDSVQESGYIEEMISGHPNSPFPVIQSTQRPDAVTASLVEGKVAILIDGSPIVLILPVTFWHGFQTVEDYYINFIFATMLRWLRFLFAFLALALPALFVAVTTFHQEMIPTSLALSLAAAREVVPFPAMMESMIMEITFEALREAGVRLPRPVGQTISIVGALVIGQAAVQAGIISAPVIIVVSLTGIASFLIPNPVMSQALSILRFPLLIFGATFGLYGIGVGLIAILIHLVNLRSFGVPYMTPLAPFNLSGSADVLVRAPWRIMHKRQQYARQKLELKKR